MNPYLLSLILVTILASLALLVAILMWNYENLPNNDKNKEREEDIFF